MRPAVVELTANASNLRGRSCGCRGNQVRAPSGHCMIAMPVIRWLYDDVENHGSRSGYAFKTTAARVHVGRTGSKGFRRSKQGTAWRYSLGLL